MMKLVFYYLGALVFGCVLSGVLIGTLEVSAPNLYQHTYDAQSIQ